MKEKKDDVQNVKKRDGGMQRTTSYIKNYYLKGIESLPQTKIVVGIS